MTDAKAMELGRLYAHEILKHDDEARKYAYHGSGFFDAFKNGFKKVVSNVPKVVATAGLITGQPEIVAPAIAVDRIVNGSGLKPILSGQTDNRASLTNFISTHRGAGKPKRQLTEKQKRRNALVRKVMKEHNLKLPEASKYIKEHNLPY